MVEGEPAGRKPTSVAVLSSAAGEVVSTALLVKRGGDEHTSLSALSTGDGSQGGRKAGEDETRVHVGG